MIIWVEFCRFKKAFSGEEESLTAGRVMRREKAFWGFQFYCLSQICQQKFYWFIKLQKTADDGE